MIKKSVCILFFVKLRHFNCQVQIINYFIGLSPTNLVGLFSYGNHTKLFQIEKGVL